MNATERVLFRLLESAIEVYDYSDPSCDGDDCCDYKHFGDCELQRFNDFRDAIQEARDATAGIPHNCRSTTYESYCMFCGKEFTCP